MQVLQAKASCLQGRRMEPQGETGGQHTNSQGTPEGAADIKQGLDQGK